MTDPSEGRPRPAVSAAAETALREAMERLFTGRSRHTDGRLTKQNLCKEAGLSRATMNRARAVLSEWDTCIAEHGKTTPGEGRRDEVISQLRMRLATKTIECTDLQRQLRAAATAIAALHHDNQALLTELDQHTQTDVIDLNQRRRPSIRTK